MLIVKFNSLLFLFEMTVIISMLMTIQPLSVVQLEKQVVCTFRCFVGNTIVVYRNTCWQQKIADCHYLIVECKCDLIRTKWEGELEGLTFCFLFCWVANLLPLRCRLIRWCVFYLPDANKAQNTYCWKVILCVITCVVNLI